MHENKKNLLDGSLAQYNDAAVPKYQYLLVTI